MTAEASSPRSDSAVRFTDVSLRFGALEVLRGVDLTFPAGSTTAVVGESGSGKTTLLQLINGMLEPDTGSVSVFGAAIPTAGRELFRRRIGYAVQGAALFPHLTARDNVTLVARLAGWDASTIAGRYAALMAGMGLDAEQVSDKFPLQLSGGQQQRLGLCRALMLEPELLLLDEPFSAVDPITRVGIYEEFEAVRRSEGVTGVLVTHDMREAVRLAQTLVILKDGAVLQSGPTAEVLDNPAHDYVRSLVTSQL